MSGGTIVRHLCGRLIIRGQRCDCTHTPADPGADECAGDAADEFERDLRMDGDL